MRCQRTFGRSGENDLVTDDVLHDGLLPQCRGLVEGIKTISISQHAFTHKIRAIVQLQDIVRKGT